MFCLNFSTESKRKCHMSDKIKSPSYTIYHFFQSMTKSKRKNGYFLVISGMQLFPAAHSNTFPFIPLIFLERQFPPCTRASHILCKMPGNSTLPFTFYLCSQFTFHFILFPVNHIPPFLFIWDLSENVKT